MPNIVGLVSLYRYWRIIGGDHFYTTNVNEIGACAHGVVGINGYKSEGVQCLIYSKPVAGSVALYRYFLGGPPLDHFYTTDSAEIGTTTTGTTGKHGYHSEGIVGYCFPNQKPGTVPLYRYYNGHNVDHFYTTNAAEIGTTTPGSVGKHGYTFEKIQCYVLPYYG